MRPELFHAAALLAGLAITLVLASWLTPRAWWRRPTARNLVIAGAGAWAFGSLAAHLAAAAPPWLPFPALPAMARDGQPRPPGLADSAGLQGAGDAAPGAASGITAPAPRRAGPASAARDAGAQRAFRVHRDLNLRAGAGVEAPLLALVPAGASVVPTGLRSGDWWQVRIAGMDRPGTGWVNSLWLRRTGEP